MNKKGLVAKVAMDTGLSKVHAEATVDSLLHGISQALRKGATVTLTGFGSFRKVGSPKGAVAKFSAGKALKDSLN